MNKKNIFVKIFALLLIAFAFLLIPNSKVSAFTIGTTPQGIAMTYYDDIDSRGFAWQTSTSVTESNLLVVKDNGQTIDWNSVTPIKGTYDDLNGFRCHRAQVTDLEGGKYYYRVGSSKGYSEVGSFVVDDSNDNKVSFVYVTDPQDESASGFQLFNQTLTTAFTHNPSFILQAGDLVNNSHANWGNDLSQIVMEEWVYAYDVTKNITMHYPMMSAAGNHESAGYSYVYHNNINYDGYGSTGGYYSFDYENLHVSVLDTNVFERNDQTAIATQMAWLEEDLANTTATWKVILLHIGPHSTGDHSNDSAAKEVRRLLPPICAEYKVDLVLQGHDHVYTRTMPYYYGEEETGKIPNRNEKLVKQDNLYWSMEPDGTYYVTMNTSGYKRYEPVAYDSSSIFPGKSPVNGKSMSQYVDYRMFAHVEIDGDSLVFKSYIAHEDGSEELYDYMAIKKNTYLDAVEAVNNLPNNITVDDALKVKEACDLVNDLSDRAMGYVDEATISKLNNILETYNLEDALAAYEAIGAIKKLNTTNYDTEFWSNYTLANEVYYSLSEAQMELVYNRNVLTDLKDNLAALKDQTIKAYLVSSVQSLVDGVTSAPDKEKARLIAKMAYEALDSELKAQIKNTSILDQSFAPEVIPTEEDGGCGGSIVGSFTAICLLGACALVIRRKRGESNE